MNNVEFHEHNGIDAPRLSPKNVKGFFETVSSIPTKVPNSFLDQVKIYVNGATVHLYVYDTINGSWERFNYYTP